MAMVPWKKTLPSHRCEKMTIVEVYSDDNGEDDDDNGDYQGHDDDDDH